MTKNFETVLANLGAEWSERVGNQPQSVQLSSGETIRIYPKSLQLMRSDFVFIARKDKTKVLFVFTKANSDSAFAGYLSDAVEVAPSLRFAPLNHQNAIVIRQHFAFTRPVLIGLDNSFGLGDRIGLANPAHLRAIADTPFRAVLAQQSIRELERTERTAEEVLDVATWAVLQEGYKQGFGADADHLKTTGDIDRLMKAGFTFYTIDPSAYVVNKPDSLPATELSHRITMLPWDIMADTPAGLLSRYEGKSFRIADGFEIKPTADQLHFALVKYGAVIARTAVLYRYLQSTYHDKPFEIELSVDETDSPTTPFEHFFIANELKRLDIKLVSLAPRFVGDFEKGIDYKGDLARFEEEYIWHAKIAAALGPYKISIHSGSDKFSVYDVIGRLKLGAVHVKTAGTSYLEALRTLAEHEPSLFGEILDFARSRYETDKASYHVSAVLAGVPSAATCTAKQLLRLFEDVQARQVLHVTFGSVLTEKDAVSKPIFKDRILRALTEHEEAHYANLQRHFQRHLKPFLQ